MANRNPHRIIYYSLAMACLLAIGTLPVHADTPDFEALAEHYTPQAIEDRRWLHEHPELSLRELETQAWLHRTLSAIDGVRLVDGDWGTGVVAILEGGRPRPLIAWRADMDGLPIIEATDLTFACTRRDTLSGGRETGVMHACGHDFHMAIGVGALRVLAEVRRDLPGSVLFIGQPAEEVGAGASMLLEAGLFEDGRRPTHTLALHVHPTIPTGQIGSRPGPSTANVDGFVLRVKGRGGHGAYPHKSIDPVSLAARMVLGFESIVAREMDVNRHCVISVGRIDGGTKSNVIPDEVLIEATVRSQDEETREALKLNIERTVRGLAAAAGAPEPELEYYYGTPAGFNDPDLVARCRGVFRRVVGDENEIVYDSPMGGEDFSYYAREVPSFQFRLGVGRPDRDMNLHRSDFDPDEQAIGLGIRVASELIWDSLVATGSAP